MTFQDNEDLEDFIDVGSRTAGPNGTEAPPPREAAGDERKLASIMDAPDYAKFISRPTTKVSREYRDRVRAMIKAGVFGCIQMEDYSDAAALIHYGPDFAIATGDIADSDPRARKYLDVLTTPGNPWVAFIMATIPLTAQLFRNHERELSQIPTTWRERRAYRRANPAEFKGTELKLGKRFRLHLHVRLRNPLKLFFAGARSQTWAPEDLTVKVFSDPKVVTALSKQGIHITMAKSE